MIILDVENILKIIDILPKLIEYIYPGYLTIYVYLFLRGKTLKDSNYIFIKSVAISYVFLSLFDTMGNIKFYQTNIRPYFKFPHSLKLNLFLIIISFTFSYIAYRIVISKQIINIFDHLKINTTFYDNEIEVLANFNEGAWVCVYLNNDDVVYEGSIGMKQLEDGKKKYICLNSYYKYLLNDDGKPKDEYIEDHADNTNEIVMIFYDDIKRIEKRDAKQI